MLSYMLSSMLLSMLLSIFLIVYIVYCSIYNSTIIKITQWKFFFIIASTKLTVINIYVKDNFGSGSRSQIIKAPQTLAPALKHCFFHSTLLFRFISLVKCFVIIIIIFILAYSGLHINFQAHRCRRGIQMYN